LKKTGKALLQDIKEAKKEEEETGKINRDSEPNSLKDIKMI